MSVLPGQRLETVSLCSPFCQGWKVVPFCHSVTIDLYPNLGNPPNYSMAVLFGSKFTD